MPPKLPLETISGAAAVQANGTMTVQTTGAGLTNVFIFSLPLPSGFTISTATQLLVQAPPGFTFPAATSGSSVSFFALAPYSPPDMSNPPTLAGPEAHAGWNFPQGTLFAWTGLTGSQEYSNITLSFMVNNLVNPTAAGMTGNLFVKVGGTNNTSCHFTIPGIDIVSSAT